MKTYIWIQESCVAQNATEPKDYIGMSMAHAFALHQFNNHEHWALGVFDVIELAALINNNPEIELRTTEVSFADGGTAVKAEHMVRALNLLLIAIQEDMVTPEEMYQRFEEIHPFTDGNGRVGTILYNWMRGTLQHPIHPPAFKK